MSTLREQLADAIKAKARELGFDLVGITGAEPSAFAPEYRDWIARGYAGEMDYLARNLERRLDPSELLPDARSIIVVGMNYYTEDDNSWSGSPRTKAQRHEEGDLAQGYEGAVGGEPRAKTQRRKEKPAVESDSPADICQDCTGENVWTESGEALTGTQDRQSTINDRAVFARYALGDDYHDVMTPRLRELLAFLKAEAGDGTEGRVYVDTGPTLEREVARRAGLGWFGKNTMLINTRRGSYFFLGEIITNIALPIDAPAVGGCGTCTRCLDACPTGAIVAPYELDARRCISYLTIELKGAIREEFRPAIAESGNRIYGCDICQEVCPFNRPATASVHPTLVPTAEPAFQPRAATTNRTLSELALLTEEEFREQFKGSPVKRTKWRGLMRNVAAALAASDDQSRMD